jgi:hypothetical protein
MTPSDAFASGGSELVARRYLKKWGAALSTREQFSDMLRLLEANRLKDLNFTVEEGADGPWPVNTSGIQIKK